MKTKQCGIYKITSPKGRIYIGQSIDLKKRCRNYKNLTCVNQTKIYNSIKKHGWESHIFEIIEECSEEELNCRERYWQDLYDVLNGGLNLVLQECGSLRAEISEETRLKMSIFHTGKIISESTRGKLREANKGEKNAMYGLRGENHPASNYKPTEEQVRKQIETYKANLTPERLKIMSERVKGENNPMYGKGFKGEDNPMFGKMGELHPKSEIYINLETGIFYFGKKEASNSLSNVGLAAFRNMLSGRDLNKTPIVKVEDYENGVAKYNESRDLKKVINTETKEIYKSINIVSKLHNIDKIKLRNMLSGHTKNKTNFMFLEDFYLEISDKRYVLDLNTGVFYYSILEASRYVDLDYSNLRRILLSNTTNNTSLIYV